MAKLALMIATLSIFFQILSIQEPTIWQEIVLILIGIMYLSLVLDYLGVIKSL
jgi:hypothetical protein